MVVAAQVAQKANLSQQGYRIVVNSGKNGAQVIPNLYIDILGG